MALPPVGVKLVAQDATGFDSALKTAGSVLDGFGKTAASVTASVNSAFSGMASAVGGALAPIGNLFDKLFNQVFRVLVRQAVRELENFIGGIAEAAIKGSDLETSLSRLGSTMDSISKVAFSGFTMRLNELVEKAAPAFLGIALEAEIQLNNLGANALNWGENFVTQFATGMWAGVGEILQVLTDIANLITYWLSPGSPPRILPDLDKWGTSAANEFFGGWGKADFSVFNDLSGTLTNLIRSIPLPKGDQVGVIPNILGARQGIAAAVEELRTTGTIATSTIDAITASVGTSDASVRDYLESMVRLEAANATTRAAQDELNKVTEKYNDLLKPVDAQIAGITEAQQQLADEQKKSLLQLILKDPGASASEKRQAALEIERLDAEKNRRALLANQKVEVDAAQEKLDAAKTAEQLAQDDFDAKKALIVLQTEQNNLLKEQLRLLEGLNKVGGPSGGGPKPAGGGKPGPSPFSIKPFDIGDLVPPDILGKWESFVNAIKAAWDKILDVFQPAIDVWNGQVVPAWEHLVNAFTSSIPDIEKAVAQMVAFIVNELGIVLVGVFQNVAISLDSLAAFWEQNHVTILNIVVGTFKIIFTTISVTLLLISGIIAAFLLLITGQWQDAWFAIQDTLAIALDAILLIVDTDTATFIATWTAVWTDAHIIVMHYIDLIREGIKTWTADIGRTIREDMAKVRDFWTGIWEMMAQALDRPMTAVSNLFSGLRELWQWIQDHVFSLQLPNIPGIDSSSRGMNGQVNGPASAATGGGSNITYGGASSTMTYAPTYISPAPPPSQGFATMQALFS